MRSAADSVLYPLNGVSMLNGLINSSERPFKSGLDAVCREVSKARQREFQINLHFLRACPYDLVPSLTYC